MSTAGLIFLGAAVLLIVIALHDSAANVCTIITGKPCTSLGNVTVSTSQQSSFPKTSTSTIPTGPNRNTGSGPDYNMSMFYSIHGA